MSSINVSIASANFNTFRFSTNIPQSLFSMVIPQTSFTVKAYQRNSTGHTFKQNHEPSYFEESAKMELSIIFLELDSVLPLKTRDFSWIFWICWKSSLYKSLLHKFQGPIRLFVFNISYASIKLYPFLLCQCPYRNYFFIVK